MTHRERLIQKTAMYLIDLGYGITRNLMPGSINAAIEGALEIYPNRDQKAYYLNLNEKQYKRLETSIKSAWAKRLNMMKG